MNSDPLVGSLSLSLWGTKVAGKTLENQVSQWKAAKRGKI